MEPNDAGDMLAGDLLGFEMDFERGVFIVQAGETAAEVVAIGRDDELSWRTILLHARQREESLALDLSSGAARNS